MSRVAYLLRALSSCSDRSSTRTRAMPTCRSSATASPPPLSFSADQVKVHLDGVEEPYSVSDDAILDSNSIEGTRVVIRGNGGSDGSAAVPRNPPSRPPPPATHYAPLSIASTDRNSGAFRDSSDKLKNPNETMSNLRQPTMKDVADVAGSVYPPDSLYYNVHGSDYGKKGPGFFSDRKVPLVARASSPACMVRFDALINPPPPPRP